MKLRESGKLDAAKLLTEMTTTTPTRASKILKTWKTPEKDVSSYSVEEAVSLIVSLNLTRDQYEQLRKGAIDHGHDLYPPYYKVLASKKQFYPEDITITEEKCEIPLQSLLNKTCQSIMQCIFNEFGQEEARSLQLICKWGFDGSSGHSSYKQIRQDALPRAEESLFATSLVPLRLVDEVSKELLWKNPQPSSKRYCRPIRLQWIHETEEVSRLEQSEVKSQIEKLTPFQSPLGNIGFHLSLTMVDGKVGN